MHVGRRRIRIAPPAVVVGQQERVTELLAPEHVDQEVGRRVEARQEVGNTETDAGPGG